MYDVLFWEINRFKPETLYAGLAQYEREQGAPANEIVLDPVDYDELVVSCPDLRRSLFRAIANEPVQRGRVRLLRRTARIHYSETLSYMLKVYDWHGVWVADLEVNRRCWRCTNHQPYEYHNISLASFNRFVDLMGTPVDVLPGYRVPKIAIGYASLQDSWLRLFYQEREGAYVPPDDTWMPYPAFWLDLEEAEMAARKTAERKASRVGNLTAWFVKEILGREIAPSDWKIIGAHAKSLLADYELADICGCLEAARDGLPDLELPDDFQVSYMTVIRRFEPPLIERWRQYKLDEPPSWMAGTHREWVERTTRTYEELDPMLRAGELRSADEPAKARRRRSPKPVAPRLLPELHEGEHLPGAHQEGSDLRQ